MTTPVETINGTPVSWVGAPGMPTTISVAIANAGPPFSDPFPQEFVPLLNAAEHEWETAANIDFVTVPDTAATDIRVGVAALAKHIGSPSMGFIGQTSWSVDVRTNHFLPNTKVTIDDPADWGVTALPDGNFVYTGTQSTIFQDLLHEIGHAIGLDHNSADPTSIMNPVISASNPVPNAQDVAAVRSLYGASTGTVVMSQADINTLARLVPPGATV